MKLDQGTNFLRTCTTCLLLNLKEIFVGMHGQMELQELSRIKFVIKKSKKAKVRQCRIVPGVSSSASVQCNAEQCEYRLGFTEARQENLDDQSIS